VHGISMQMRIRNRISRLSIEFNHPISFDWKSLAACIIGGILLYPLVSRLPVVGWDWGVYFAQHRLSEYPPWSKYVLEPLISFPWRMGLALLNGLMLMTVAVATSREDKSDSLRSKLLAAFLALVSPPTLYLLWQGNIDGLILLGLIAIPIGIPLALVKPHLSIWALISRKSSLLWTVALLALSLLIWRAWPIDLFATLGARNQHPMAMGWQNLSWVILAIGIVLLVFSDADPFQLMCAGAFVSPYLLPQHLLLILPAIGKLRGTRRLIVWLFSMFAALPPMVLSWGLYLAYLFPLITWLMLRIPSRRNLAGDRVLQLTKAV